jgi:chromosome segregation ATPase
VKADYAKLLESSTVVTNKLREEVQEVRSQLEAEKTRGEELWEELTDTEQALAEVRSENSELKKTCADLRSQLATQGERTPQHQLYSQIEELKERNRLLCIKSREERQKLEEKIKTLEYRDKSQSRRLGEKQARLDELEVLLEGELSDLKQKSAAARELPEAAEILNQLKSKRKKSKTDLTDLEVILEILES